MFYAIYAELCKQKGVSESKAAESIGLKRASVIKWKKGAVPSGATLQKFSDYFGVTTDYLLGQEIEKSPSTPEGEGLSEPWMIEAISLLRQLDPENQRQVFDFAQALLKIQESAGGQSQKGF